MFSTEDIAVSEFRNFKKVLDIEGVNAALTWAEGRLRDIERESVPADEKDRRIRALRVIVERY